MLYAGLISLLYILYINLVWNFFSPWITLTPTNDQEIYFAKAAAPIMYFENVGVSIPKQCNPADLFKDNISGQGERYAKPGFKKSHMTIPALVDR